MSVELVLQIGSFVVAIVVCVGTIQWRNDQMRKETDSKISRVYTRFDEFKDKWHKTLKEDYVDRELHDLINQQHTDNIHKLEKDIHDIKVSLEAIGKNVSILVAHGGHK